MVDAKFTPGPWFREGTGVWALQESGEYEGRGKDYRPRLTNRFYFQVQGGRDKNYDWTPEEELEGNARLIAAAPELYSALDSLVGLAAPHFTDKAQMLALAIATAALNKACGE